MSAPFNQTQGLVGPYQSCSAGGTGSSTATFSIPNTALYSIKWKCQVPSVVGGGGASGLVVQIKDGGSTLFTGTAGACNGGMLYFNATAGDSVTFNLSSTAAADLASLNAVQATIALSQEV